MHQTIACINRINGWARLVAPTRPIHFASSDTGNADLRPLCAPHGAVAVVNGSRRAFERLARRHEARRTCFGFVGKRRERRERLGGHECRQHERESEFRQEAHY
jgi:hypothetical protein